MAQSTAALRDNSIPIATCRSIIRCWGGGRLRWGWCGRSGRGWGQRGCRDWPARSASTRPAVTSPPPLPLPPLFMPLLSPTHSPSLLVPPPPHPTRCDECATTGVCAGMMYWLVDVCACVRVCVCGCFGWWGRFEAEGVDPSGYLAELLAVAKDGMTDGAVAAIGESLRLEPGGCTAFRSHSNTNTNRLTHPAKGRRVRARLRPAGILLPPRPGPHTHTNGLNGHTTRKIIARLGP